MHGPLPPFPQYVFMEWCLVKHRHNFTFLLTTVHFLGLLSVSLAQSPFSMSCGSF